MKKEVEERLTNMLVYSRNYYIGFCTFGIVFSTLVLSHGENIIWEAFMAFVFPVSVICMMLLNSAVHNQ